jgi:redox-sensitive bicupin YhaK (pirin superfamily)
MDGMSNLDARPVELASPPPAAPQTAPVPPAAVEVLQPREVPLGGVRAMTVRRTLPQRQRSLIGGWCFADHYGPDPVAGPGAMSVPPHPHTCLQTVSWLFSGEIEHRDSAGNHVVVRPGELNLMTAGRGISHSEVPAPGSAALHGVQLWVALPSAARFTEPGLEHYAPESVPGDGFTTRLFLGSLLGSTAPVAGYSPLLGAEITLAAGRVLRVPAEPSFEYGVLVDTGTVTLNGTLVETARLGYVSPGAGVIELRAAVGDGADAGGARVLLLGGEPLGEQIVMWWNFIGRSHEEIVRFRASWQARIGAAPAETAPAGTAPAGTGPAGTVPDGLDPAQFGLPAGDPLPPIPAPPLPNNVKLRPRR